MSKKINALGEMIKKARISKGINQIDLATKLGWGSGQYVSNIERGTVNPPEAVVPKLVEILGLDIKKVYTCLYKCELGKLKARYAKYL